MCELNFEFLATILGWDIMGRSRSKEWAKNDHLWGAKNDHRWINKRIYESEAYPLYILLVETYIY